MSGNEWNEGEFSELSPTDDFREAAAILEGGNDDDVGATGKGE